MTKKPQIPATHVITDLETLKVISDPFRIDLIRMIHEANMEGRFSTVKEISETLDLPPTKLYYHINLLEKHGLIVVGDTKVVSGIIEKQYQIVADDITIAPEVLSTSETSEDEKLEFMLQSMRSFLDSTYEDIKRSMTKAFKEKDEEKTEQETKEEGENSSELHFTKSAFYLTPEDVKTLSEELKEIHNKYDALSKHNFKTQIKDTKIYGLSIILAAHHHRTPPENNEESNTND